MSEFKHIVRIAGRDLEGTKKVVVALSELRGVGYNLASAIVNSMRIDSRARLGSLGDHQVAQIEEALRDLNKMEIPFWLMNRRKDVEMGLNYHLIGPDLELATKNDIGREKSVGSWRGVRHFLGLKVRGQRTRTTGRKGKTVGVKKAERLPSPTTSERS